MGSRPGLSPVLATILLLTACTGRPGGAGLAAGQPPAPQFLFNQAFPSGRGALRATVDREVYPPHYAGTWHTHPGPGSFCSLEGTLTIEVRGAAAVTLTPGQCWTEEPGVVHRPANRTDQPAVALFYLLAPDGRPRAIPEPTATP